MTTQEALQKAEAALQDIGGNLTKPAADRLDLAVPPADLLRAIEALQRERLGYLSAITGLDWPATTTGGGAIEVLYHFCEGAAVVTLRVKVPYETARVPDICGLVPYATLYQRELAETFQLMGESASQFAMEAAPESTPIPRDLLFEMDVLPNW